MTASKTVYLNMLYDASMSVYKRFPWNDTEEDQFFAVQRGLKRDTVYYLFQENRICIYEGDYGLETYLLMRDRKELGLKEAFTRKSQNVYLVVWDENLPKETRRLKNLGYDSDSIESTMHFYSCTQGESPRALDEDEIHKMISYIIDGRDVYDNWKQKGCPEYESEKCYKKLVRKGVEKYGLATLNITEFAPIEMQAITQDIVQKMHDQGRVKAVLEMELGYGKKPVKKGTKMMNPIVCVIADQLNNKMIDTTEVMNLSRAQQVARDQLVNFILENGMPDEVHTSNRLVASAVADIAELCNITVRENRKLVTAADIIEHYAY